MIRRKARELALQALFTLDFGDMPPIVALAAVAGMQEKEVPVKVMEYAAIILQGTRANLDEIDKIVTSLAHDWKLDRMPAVDRNITRLAIYEMRFSEELVPEKAAVNEAVELAKKYGSDDSGRFINGMLGALIKNKT